MKTVLTDDVLLDLAAEPGRWCLVATLGCSDSARFAVRRWRKYCVAVKWNAFEFRQVDGQVFGRFVGTRMTRATVRKGKTWTGSLRVRTGDET